MLLHLMDPLDHCILVLQLPVFRGDEAEDDGVVMLGSLCQCESPGTVGIVF